MAKLVSKTYGDAMFALALEQDTISTLKKETQAVIEIFDKETDFLKLLSHPKVSMNEKVAMIEAIFKGRVSDDMTGFLTVIVNKGRYDEIPAIFAYIEKKIKEHQKIGVAQVTAPMELTKVQKQAIEKRLLETTSYETFEIDYQIDESLIGGLIIRINDRVVDSSIKTKIANMAKELNKIQLG